MEDMDIRFDGIDALDENERQIADKIAKHHYPKLQRAVKNTVSLVVHIRAHNESEGHPKKQRMFSVHVHVNAPTKTFRSSRAHDWDLATSLQKAFTEVQDEIGHSFKNKELRRIRSVKNPSEALPKRPSF